MAEISYAHWERTSSERVGTQLRANIPCLLVLPIHRFVLSTTCFFRCSKYSFVYKHTSGTLSNVNDANPVLRASIVLLIIRCILFLRFANVSTNQDEAHHALAKRDWNSKNHRYNSSNEHGENLESKDASQLFKDQRPTSNFNGIFIGRSIIASNGAIEQRHGSAAILAFCHPHEVCLSRVKALDTDWRRTQKVEKRAARTANGSPTTNESEVRSFARKIIRGTKRGRQGRDRVQTAWRNRA